MKAPDDLRLLYPSLHQTDDIIVVNHRSGLM